MLRPERSGVVSFRVPARVIAAKSGVAVVLAVASLALGSGVGRPVGLAGAVAVGLYAARDLLVRERLRADATGVVTVYGYARRRHLTWAQVERVRVDVRNRLGARSELLELDADDELYLLSRFDLGVEPDEALAALQSVRPDH